mgnify:CR=1 FL=1
MTVGSGEEALGRVRGGGVGVIICCLLYTSDAADERSSVDLGGRRIIKKKTNVVSDGGRAMLRVVSR